MVKFKSISFKIIAMILSFSMLSCIMSIYAVAYPEAQYILLLIFCIISKTKIAENI